MSFSNTLKRLQEIVEQRDRGVDIKNRLVSVDDLSELLAQFTAADSQLRSLHTAHEALKVELALVIDGNEAEVNHYKRQLAEVAAERDTLRMEKENPPAELQQLCDEIDNFDYDGLKIMYDEVQAMELKKQNIKD